LTGENFKQDSKTLSKHVSYSHKKKEPTLALTQDAFACDESCFYHYNEDSGLTKCKRGQNGEWSEIVK
jgi:hypothetical protein